MLVEWHSLCDHFLVVSLGVCLLDKNLKKVENTVINLSFDAGLYQLADVQYTKTNKIVLLGKEFEEAQIGKKKRLENVGI